MHAARLEQIHREELEHERAEEMSMPGLGFEGGLLEQLQQQGEFDWKIFFDSFFFSFDLDDVNSRREAGIPGLDFSNDDEESRRRRVCS
jgi:hypothetical protein